MCGRCRPVSQPVVDLGDAVLDAGQRRIVGFVDGRRPFELEQCLVVAPEGDERGADGAPYVCFGSRVAELEGRSQVKESLRVGVQRLRPKGCPPGPVERLVGSSRFTEVRRHRGRRRARQPTFGAAGQCVCCAAVQEPPTRGVPIASYTTWRKAV